ncbi:hypothetical protein Vadar_005571 [Vaccinium darrowii]|uniref:Uncharacterized protein n=1 Tax=Vaccinium darrowii TaxID=229202 RepID=A0ACB7YTH6_9ERIC|nr:hypothetical protein Vadar_005571 [Vaccinium darrowii]
MNPMKIQATKMHKKQQLLHNLFIYSLTALTSSSLICFSPILHPLFSCIKVLLVLPTPEITSLFFNSKFLFIVGNLIFLILISESKIFTSYATSISDFHYKSLDNLSLVDKKEEENMDNFCEDKIYSCEGGEGKFEESVEEKQDMEEEIEERMEEMRDVEEELDEEGKSEEWIEERQDVEEDLEEWIEEMQQIVEEEFDGKGFGLPVKDLTKRVDDFIARVQRQRSLELLAYNCCE